MAILIGINTYSFCFNAFNLTPMYIVMTEISSDIALGVGTVVATLIMAFFTLTIFHLIALLGTSGFFFALAIECVIGYLFIYLFVGESLGLLPREKREQYWPGARHGRTLYESERCEAVQSVWSAATKNSQVHVVEQDSDSDEDIGIGASHKGSIKTRE